MFKMFHNYQVWIIFRGVGQFQLPPMGAASAKPLWKSYILVRLTTVRLLMCWDHYLSCWPILSHCSLCSLICLYPFVICCLLLRLQIVWGRDCLFVLPLYSGVLLQDCANNMIFSMIMQIINNSLGLDPARWTVCADPWALWLQQGSMRVHYSTRAESIAGSGP